LHPWQPSRAPSNGHRAGLPCGSSRYRYMRDTASLLGQLHELVAGLRLVLQDAAERAGDGMVPLLADAAGFHAHVASADDHPYPLRLQMLLQRVGDLIGEPLLDLKPTGEHVRQAGELGQHYILAVRDVGDSSRTENVRQVVLTFGVDW